MSNFLMSEKSVKTTVPSLKKKLINFMRTLQHVPAEAKSDMEEVITLLQQKHIQILPANAEQEVKDYIELLFKWYPTIAKHNTHSADRLKLSIAKAVEQANKEVNNKQNFTKQ